MKASLALVTAVLVMDSVAAATPICNTFTRGGGPSDPAIVTAPDGTVWYANISGNRLMRVGPDRRETPVIPVDAQTGRLSGLAFGPDGNLWYTKDTSGRIGKIPPAGGQGIEYATSERPPFVKDIVNGPGSAMWFYDPVHHYVGRITTDGAVTQFKGPISQSRPFTPSAMAAGQDGNLWLTDIGHNSIYRVTSGGTFTRFDIPSPNAQPGSIASARDGSLCSPCSRRASWGASQLKAQSPRLMSVPRRRPMSLSGRKEQFGSR